MFSQQRPLRQHAWFFGGIVGLQAIIAGCTVDRINRLCKSDGVCSNEQVCDLASGFCVPKVIKACSADADCAGGYCQYNACLEGLRPPCDAANPCSSGACLGTQCVECLFDDDCDSSLECSTSHTCVTPITHCTAASCGLDGKICDTASQQCRDCLENIECGTQICTTGTCGPCVDGNDCGSGKTCSSGQCVPDPAALCVANPDCGDRVCVQVGADKQCSPCAFDNECGAGRTCDNGTCQPLNPDCFIDAHCSPPNSVCFAGGCENGCAVVGCAPGQECNLTTGRCVVTSAGSVALGQACSYHAECLSEVCWPIDTGTGTPTFRCSEACSRHDDCPNGFVCYELGDSNACVDKSLVAPAAPLDVPPGGMCNTSFVNDNCATGYCNTSLSECMQTCASNADCADQTAQICSARWPVGNDANDDGFLSSAELDGFTELCVPTTLGSATAKAPPLAPCVSHEACDSGYCAATPNLFVAPRCAQPCCTPADCTTSSNVCKPLHVWDGIADSSGEPFGFQKVCLWHEYPGTKELGETCSTDAECKSEICVAGITGAKKCTQTCCTNQDCAPFVWADGCRPFFAGSHVLADDNYDAASLSLGRQIAPIVPNSLIATAMGSVCVPH